MQLKKQHSQAPKYRQLILRSEKARELAYAPYSKFAVGAALLTSGGKIYEGANIENASYSLTICAERSAVIKAVLNGERKFAAIAVIGPVNNRGIYPCGACLQVLAEFSPEMKIVLKIKGKWQVRKLKQLLPGIFQKDEL